MKTMENLLRYYRQKLSLLNQLAVINDSILELAKCDLFNQASAMIDKRENLINLINKIEKEILYLKNSARPIKKSIPLREDKDLRKLIIIISGTGKRIKFVEKEIKDIINSKKTDICFELNKISNIRKLLRQPVHARLSNPQYLSYSA